VGKAKTWKVWPAFDASYLAALALAVLAFGVAFLTQPGLFGAFRTWPFVASVALAYSGEDLARKILKGVEAVRTMARHWDALRNS
jgi:hypothetical protein